MSNNSPDQFKLFMTGKEWRDSVTHSTDGPIRPGFWEAKAGEAKAPRTGLQGSQPAVYNEMRQHGYQHDSKTPPTIILEESPSGKSVRRVQSEGHRRIAAAATIEEETGRPVYIPTNYVDNTISGRRARGSKS